MTIGLKLLIFITLAAAVAAAEAQSLAGCLNKCGDVDIPYPFGVGVQDGTSHNCFLEPSSFNLTCHNSTLFLFGNLPVNNISVQDGHMVISMFVSKICYNQQGGTGKANDPYLILDPSSLTISSTQNKFVSVGCDTLGIIRFQNNFTYYGGCVALCDSMPPSRGIINDQACSGTGCCKVDIPEGTKNISFVVSSVNNHTKVLKFNNCSYAFLVKQDWFDFSLDYLRSFPYDKVPLVLDWTISNDTCEVARTRSDYACSTSNTECYNSTNGFGYNCKCKSGFEGNPYHPDGCHDVNECDTQNNCSKEAQCHNFDGGYSCSCPSGYTGNGSTNGTGCTQSNRVSVAMLFVFTLGSTLWWAHKKRILKELRRRNFEENGGNILLQQLSQQQEYTGRTKIFTEVELKNATNNFDEGRILGRGGQGIVYKGILLDNTHVAIKKSRAGGDPRQIKDFINEVAVLSQVNHRNVVKLLGCCLETEVPLLVYEFVDNGTLLDHIDPLKNGSSILWETRLKIAAETADAISYLHSAASIPIIHRDIKSANILLDQNHRAKVSDFGASRLVPLDETHVTTVVQGTFGYLDPEYLHIGQLNEKSDVYSFGVVLVELLTGKKAFEFNRPEQINLAMHFVSSMQDDRLWEIIDKQVLDQKNAEQLKEVALLAGRCVRVKGEERPAMKEVAMELAGLTAMEKHPWDKGEDLMLEENEYLLGHVSDKSGEAGASNSVTYGSIQKQISFEIVDGR